MAILDALRSFFTLPPPFRPLDGPSPRWEQPDAERALSFETIFGHDLPHESSRVDSETARRNPFVWACQSIISGTIANLPLDVLRKEGDVHVPITAPPWVETPNPFNPNFTSISYKRQLTLSLLQDGNAFVAVSEDVDNPFRLLVLNPVQVEIKDGDNAPAYVVTAADKRTTLAVLNPFNCLHIPFILPPGYTRGLNPVEAQALSIGIDLAAQKQASKFISGGGLVTGVIEVPAEAGPMTQEQMDAMREGFKRRREGPNGYSIGVLQGGATFKTVSQSQAESDYIAGRKLSREEIAGMYLVPAFMIGSQEPGGVAYASAVERAQHFIDYCLIHYGGPIEKGHNRLVPGPDTFTKLNYNALLKGDLKTRYDAYALGLQNKFLFLEDVWLKEDLNPNRAGTFLETPNNNGPRDASPQDAARDVHIHVPEVTLPDTVNMPAPQVYVDVPAPIVHVEAQPAPVVNVAAAEAPIVNIDLAEHSRTIARQTEAIVALAETQRPRAVRKTVLTDKQGKISGVIEEPI